MALNSVRYDFDPKRSGLTRDYWVSAPEPSRVTLLVTGTLAGVDVEILTPAMTLAGMSALVIAEGSEYTNVGGNPYQTLVNLVTAMANLTENMIKVRSVERVGSNAQAVLDVGPPGTWGTGVTLEVLASANAGNLSVNGTAGAGVYNPTNNNGDAVAEFEAFLQSLGVPISSIRVHPLFAHSTSFLVTWET